MNTTGTGGLVFVIRSLGSIRPLAHRLFVGVGALPVVIIVLGVIFWYFQPRFLSETNLINVARQGSFLAIAACAQMFPILSGGFDLSVGAVFALVSVIMAQLTLEVGMAWGITVALCASPDPGTSPSRETYLLWAAAVPFWPVGGRSPLPEG